MPNLANKTVQELLDLADLADDIDDELDARDELRTRGFDPYTGEPDVEE